MTDVVVIGAGPNGLVAANVLADHGLSVVVFEAQPAPGGAVRSGQITLPGYEHDLFSAFYPFAVASPAIRQLALEDHGLVWRRAPLVLAHPTPDGPAAVLSMDLGETAASLDAFAAGDGDAWRRALCAMAADRRSVHGRVDDAVPAHARARADRADAVWPASPARRCRRSAGSRASTSVARAAGCCSPAARCTATSRPTPPAAARSAGSCARSASSAAFRCPRAARDA